MIDLALYVVLMVAENVDNPFVPDPEVVVEEVYYPTDQVCEKFKCE